MTVTACAMRLPILIYPHSTLVEYIFTAPFMVFIVTYVVLSLTLFLSHILIYIDEYHLMTFGIQVRLLLSWHEYV